jgi:anti-sigma factor RsiW
VLSTRIINQGRFGGLSHEWHHIAVQVGDAGNRAGACASVRAGWRFSGVMTHPYFRLSRPRGILVISAIQSSIFFIK